MSDSSYAKTRFLYTHANASRAYPSRPANIDLIDDDWATDTLSDDDVEVNLTSGTPSSLALQETLLKFQREEEALEGEQKGTFEATFNGNTTTEDEQWNDLGLDELQAELVTFSLLGNNFNEESVVQTGEEQQNTSNVNDEEEVQEEDDEV